MCFGRADGTVLVSATIDTLCRDPSSFAALKSLEYVQYVGTTLGVEGGKKLNLFVKLLPCIGGTEVGGYCTNFKTTARTGTTLSLARVPEPNLSHVPIKALWLEDPTRKGLFRIVGRMDDYIPLAYGEGLYASTMQQEIERHELVQKTLIGGHGQQDPVLLIETIPGVYDEGFHAGLMQSLLPYLE
ncbi:hypothetical protein BCON_0131g00230 [Botryotinia convoluta]|uniref:Uncharacterized protein n=1 Tax=Botryotinia convoluta TaxID=54673 RepID=A0A4Z1HWA3_9HELO|nr:hypothetical protein BCON_0131g00230 [Botryotinia convoluta]